ncbi:MAG: hypothetical protein AAGF45_10340 [Pseudomonadota bacterium]
MQASFQDNVDEIAGLMTDLQRKQLPFFVSRALNDCAFGGRRDLQDTVRQVFDRPKPFTVNSPFVRKATKSDLSASVEFKDELASGRGTPAGKYLQAQVFGGERRHKRFEKALIARGIMERDQFAVPGPAAKLDKYGALSGGLIMRILSALGATQDVGFQQAQTARSRGRNKNRAVDFARPGDMILQRKGSRVEPVLIFTYSLDYEPRLPMQRVLERAADREFGPSLERQLEEFTGISAGGVPF